MTNVNRSARAVQTLAQVDPLFTDLVDLVYGGAVDPEIVWADTFGKMAPDQADVNTREPGRLARRAAFAGTVAGGVLGAKELGRELPKLGGRTGRAATRAVESGGNAYKKLVPTGVQNAVASPRGRVGVAGTALGADVLASAVLGRKPKNDVAKLEVPSVSEMARGIKNKLTGATNRLIPTGSPAGAQVRPRVNNVADAGKPAAPGTGTATPNSGAPAAGTQAPGQAGSTAAAQPGQAAPAGAGTPGQGGTPGNPKAQGNWQQFGQGVGQAVGSTPGKVLIGTGVAAAALKARQMRQQGQPAPVDPNDPYGQNVGKLYTEHVVRPDGQVDWRNDDGYQGTDRQAPPGSRRVRKFSLQGGNVVKRASNVVWEGTFSKFDDDKQLAFGWASVVEINGQPVVDRQGDYISADDLEDAAYKYMLESRKGGHMHRRDELDQPVGVSDIVESVVFTPEKIAKMGLPSSTPVGWWIGTKIHDSGVWQEVKKGNLGGFSIHGKGRRQEIPMDQLMGY